MNYCGDMRTRAAELPDWVGTDKGGASFVTIQSINLPFGNSALAIKAFVYSFIDPLGKVSLSGIDLRGTRPGHEEEFPHQNGKCSILSIQESGKLLKAHDLEGLLPAASLLGEFSTPAMRALLTSHLMGRFLYEHSTYGEFEEEDDELECLGSRYSTFVKWGEASPALAIATATGKTVEEIHNRLKVARRRNYLPTAGQGVRGANLQSDFDYGTTKK